MARRKWNPRHDTGAGVVGANGSSVCHSGVVFSGVTRVTRLRWSCPRGRHSEVVVDGRGTTRRGEAPVDGADQIYHRVCLFLRQNHWSVCSNLDRLDVPFGRGSSEGYIVDTRVRAGTDPRTKRYDTSRLGVFRGLRGGRGRNRRIPMEKRTRSVGFGTGRE